MKQQTFFETTAMGKWILAGEHSVLRGCTALVFPLKSKVLKLTWTKTDSKDLDLVLTGPHGSELQLLFFGVLERACNMKSISRSKFSGLVQIENQIPLGAGMGASAALCVAVTKWLNFLGEVSSDEMFDFARNLENLFHGESSGVDIAVALSSSPLRFKREGLREAFEAKWHPNWYISYSGQRGVTSECVSKVKALIAADPKLGAELDQQMQDSVSKAEKALGSLEEQGKPELIESINMAKNCFDRWGLTPVEHCNELLSAGAIAVKPTGSGGGGYVLSLWQSEPPSSLRDRLISC